jgi:hypothetical protein
VLALALTFALVAFVLAFAFALVFAALALAALPFVFALLSLPPPGQLEKSRQAKSRAAMERNLRPWKDGFRLL